MAILTEKNYSKIIGNITQFILNYCNKQLNFIFENGKFNLNSQTNENLLPVPSPISSQSQSESEFHSSFNSSNSHFPFFIDLIELSNFDINLTCEILKFPTECISIFNEAIEISYEIYEETQIKKQKQSDQQLENNINFSQKIHKWKPKLHCRFLNFPIIPLCFGFNSIHRQSLDNITIDDINHFVVLNGVVTHAQTSNIILCEQTFRCNKCNSKQIQKSNFENSFKISPPDQCIKCQNNTNFIPTDHTIYSDIQFVRLQEQLANYDKIQLNLLPLSVQLLLCNDLIDTVRVGDVVEVTGIIRKYWTNIENSIISKGNTSISIELIVECNSMNIKKFSRNSSNSINSNDQNYYQTFWSNNHLSEFEKRNIIVKSVCPQLYGLYSIKLANLLTIIGGVPQYEYNEYENNLNDQSKSNNSAMSLENDIKPDFEHDSNKFDQAHKRVRGQGHLLLVGDPSTGLSN